VANRDLTAGFKTELEASTNYPFFLFEGTFDATTLNYNTLGRDITWDSKTWVGNGYLKGLPTVSETQTVSAAGITIELAGEPSVIISTILNNANHGETGKLYFGFLNSSGAVIADPHLLFDGTLSTAELRDSINKASIYLTYESSLINVLNNNEFRYNTKTQNLNYPTDVGFAFMESLANWSGYWGKKNKKNRKNKRNKGKD